MITQRRALTCRARSTQGTAVTTRDDVSGESARDGSAPTLLDGAPPTAHVDDGPLTVGATFAGRYHVKRRIGTGGMGAVYQAFDTVLSEDVAIKLIRPEILADPQTAADIERRFKRELLTGRRVSHPGVVRVHDFGESRALRYLTMSYVEGRDLSRVLEAEGALSPSRVVRIGRRLGSALAAVHAAGVIHRDLKPANVMLGRGDRVWLTDFGVARLVNEAVDDGTAGLARSAADASDAPTGVARPSVGARLGTLTTLGARIGTPEFMAPEQATGGRVDVRTDVYGLGLVLYDLLTGGTRGARFGSAEAELQARSVDAPHVRVHVPEVSEALDATLARALDPDPARRYASVTSLVDALAAVEADMHDAGAVDASWTKSGPRLRGRAAWLGAAVAVLAVVLAGLLAFRGVRDGAPAPSASAPPEAAAEVAPALQSVAVLPFADLSPGRDQDYLAKGIAEELRDELSQVPGLRVPGRTSSSYFEGKRAPVAEIGRQLGVTHLLEGSVRRSGDRLRVGASLVRVADGAQVWTKSFDRPVGDLFAIQDEIAAAVAWAFSITWRSAIAEDRPATAEAFDLYLRSITTSGSDAIEGLQASVELLRRALALDPTYALAWGELAGVLGGLADITQREDYLREARDAADRAIALAPKRAHGYLARAWLLHTNYQDWDGALRDLDRARALQPDDLWVMASDAYALGWQGRIPEAIDAYERVLELDPLRSSAFVNLGQLYTATGRYADARRLLTRALELNPSNAAPLFLGELELLAGRPDAARAAFDRVDDEAFRLYGTALLEHSLGDRRRSDAALSELIARNSADAAYQIAAVYAWRGENDLAFEWLGRAHVQRDGGLAILRIDPIIASLRRDPRWQPLVEKVGLATPRR
jgi:serine/threonine-protein kinase